MLWMALCPANSAYNHIKVVRINRTTRVADSSPGDPGLLKQTAAGYVCILICMYIYMCIYVYIHVYKKAVKKLSSAHAGPLAQHEGGFV